MKISVANFKDVLGQSYHPSQIIHALIVLYHHIALQLPADAVLVQTCLVVLLVPRVLPAQHAPRITEKKMLLAVNAVKIMLAWFVTLV